MDRDDLLRTLISAKELEETHSSLITKFFLHEFDWSDYDPDKVKMVKSIIETIEEQSIQHANALEEIIDSISRMKSNEI